MKRIALAAAMLLAAFVAQAQIYQWQDEKNTTVISDRPPPANVTGAQKIEADAAPGSDASDQTLADREMAFRKRQKESQEGAEQADKDQRLAALKKENCENARRSLQLLESGERVAMRDSKGERYYLDEAQRTQEIAKLRQDVQANCH
ncbi:MAG: DUF4124 domain-containing protein [Candidatus Accumulibacter meliphilus]|jgi:hypothetical protein|uniref:DUF4124 domain-containing protein n=1 Tax=Candidatus Accumulibacter meliphilus TaxID=2211374 RepID=A0A369XNE7_9PROT|nr:MAG: DUF4124 domain-containing protein [Candidatus Accumulibacter meliphilus]